MKLTNILFLDIETATEYPTYAQLPAEKKLLWDEKAQSLKQSETDTPEQLYEKAGLFAEFGKIVCISMGIVYNNSNGRFIKVKSFYGNDERNILIAFADFLHRNFNTAEKSLCAHNGKGFDYPYICRRMLINRINLPTVLDIRGKKPWEIQLHDTLEIWKFGDYKGAASLKLLAGVFGIPSPKDDIDGSMVSNVFWVDQNYERIATYCQKDIITLAQVFLCMQNEQLLDMEHISYAENEAFNIDTPAQPVAAAA
jgi:predicted PolB exonuclease-like 3'-5' exonuclease